MDIERARKDAPDLQPVSREGSFDENSKLTYESRFVHMHICNFNACTYTICTHVHMQFVHMYKCTHYFGIFA